MSKARAFTAAFLFLVALQAFSQSPEAFSPFVSRLKAEVTDNRIKLTWKDSTDVEGDCLIYRATQEITDAVFSQATLIATVPGGIEFFIDTPSDEKAYYYAVLVQDSSKKLYKIFIPFRNVTSFGAAVSTTSPEEALAAVITGIRAAAPTGEDSIILSFQSSKTDRDLLVFWGTSPLARAEDLLRGASKAALDPGVTSYKIPVVRGVDYYFAVLDSGLFKIGKTPLVPGQNTTTSPVQIPLPPRAASSPTTTVRRALPLPSLQLAEGQGAALHQENASALPEEKPVSAATTKAIGEIMKEAGSGQGRPTTLDILEDDRTPAASGELASLQAIVSGQFGKADYAETERLIRDFLSIGRSAEVEARARFYLGQVIFFQNKPREAAMEFIMARDYFYRETQRWLDICLRAVNAAQ